MARMKYKNAFGSQVDGSRLDLQRVDLFKVTLELPTALGLPWDEHVEFAIEKFPFPDRAREAIAVKYMQQTNFLIGGDMAPGPAEIPVRYAFAQRTAECLEKWHWLIANPVTGGVALTSEVKSKGFLRWLVPNMRKQKADVRGQPRPGEDTMVDGATYILEGCWIKGLKFADADMTASGVVNMTLSLMVDRWYAENTDRLQVQPLV
jgi:hypothetical protein